MYICNSSIAIIVSKNPNTAPSVDELGYGYGILPFSQRANIPAFVLPSGENVLHYSLAKPTHSRPGGIR